MESTTYIKNGFTFFKEHVSDDSILGDRLIVDSTKLRETVRYINDNNIKSISISPSYYSLDNIDFVQETRNIQGIYILKEKINVTQVNYLNKLKVLRLSKVLGNLDFMNFPDLVVLSCVFSKSLINLSKCCKVFWLWLDGFPNSDLQDLSEYSELKYLTLLKCGMSNLTGIENCIGLKLLRIDTAKKLTSLKGIKPNLMNLSRIDIYNAPSLTDYNDLNGLLNLHQLDLRKTGETNSINYIDSLNNLEQITLGLKVGDGKMDNLKKVKKVGFIDYPHYNLKLKDFKVL